MERRSEARIETRVYLDCRVPALPRKAILLDVSTRGCRVGLPSFGQLKLGSTILFDLPDSPRFPGTVVWLAPGSAGIKFVHPLKRTTSIALGLVEPEPEPTPEFAQVDMQSATVGLLRHWIRRITAALG
jgi:hypothetical protein